MPIVAGTDSIKIVATKYAPGDKVCTLPTVCIHPLDHTKNYTDLKFGTNSPQDHI